ncbi:hypothetical protein DTO217A2_8002 [Paecilomyces variotii]|nr:hypothetical protein DTO217A2_8002 [Paecilomyces variotii]
MELSYFHTLDHPEPGRKLLAAFETSSDLTPSFCFRPPILMRFPNHSYHLCGCLNNPPTMALVIAAVCRGCMAPLHPGLILHV